MYDSHIDRGLELKERRLILTCKMNYLAARSFIRMSHRMNETADR